MSKPRKHGKKWQIRWYDETGKRRSEVFEQYQDAVFALGQRHAEVGDLRRGFRLRPAGDRLFKELAKKWLELRTDKRTLKDDRFRLKKHLLPRFENTPLRNITTESIAELSAELSIGRKPQTVLHVLNLLGTMLRYAVDWGWLDTIPRIRKPKVRLFDKDYRWLRTNEEIALLLDAAKDEALPMVYPLYTTAIFTGMRAGELAGLRWQDIDFKRRLICVQRSYNGPTKAGDIRHAPIVDRLLPVLKEWRLKCRNKLVFPNKAGNMWDKNGRIFSEILRRTLLRAGFEALYVNFHGLRHTFASHWIINGGDLFRLQKILGHKSPTMTQRYAHLAPSAYESDWGRFGQHKEESEAEVVEIKKAHK